MKPRVEVAILGAGPIGLEAALAAADLGLDFLIFEASDRPAGNVRDWGHIRLFTPWSMNVSSRARTRLQAAGVSCSDGGDCPTGHELFAEFLEPLCRLPEISGRVRCGARVVAVSREGLLKSDEIGGAGRNAGPFRLLIDGVDGEQVVLADVVLDCTGTYHNPNALGSGGIPAPGERTASGRIVRRIPDFDREGASFEGKRVLLVGGGHSAQTVAVALADMVDRAPGTDVTWAIRSAMPDFAPDAHDVLTSRHALHAAAQEVVDGQRGLRVLPGCLVDRLEERSDGLRVHLVPVAGATEGTAQTEVGPGDERAGIELDVDIVLALTGAVGEQGLYRQLQVHECWATTGPMKLAASLLANGSVDCLAQGSHGPEVLRNPEPDFFILGSKSYGRNNSFLLRVGWEQVDDVFSILTARQSPAVAGEPQ